MAKIETIKDLNQRWWYRLVKVIFLLSLICIAVVGIFVTYEVYKPRLVDDYKVTCNYGHKGSFYAERDKSIYISSYEVEGNHTVGSMSDSKKEELQSACGMSESEMQALLEEAFDRIQRGEDDGIDYLWSVSPVEYKVRSETEAALYAIFTVLVTVGVFELLRRIFYYIVLGSARPKKDGGRNL